MSCEKKERKCGREGSALHQDLKVWGDEQSRGGETARIVSTGERQRVSFPFEVKQRYRVRKRCEGGRPPGGTGERWEGHPKSKGTIKNHRSRGRNKRGGGLSGRMDSGVRSHSE